MMKKRHNLFNCKQLNKEFLYINSLSSGVGNNDIGLIGDNLEMKGLFISLNLVINSC